MKKVLLSVLFMAAFTAAQAGIDYGLDAGQTRFGVFGGVSAPMTDWKAASGTEFKAGKEGFLFGAELLRNITPAFALGMEFSYASHPNKSVDTWKVKSEMYNANILARVNLFPSSPTRLYIPFGAGYSYFKVEDNLIYERSQSTVQVFAGLGLEFDLSPLWTVGLEGRLSYLPLDDDDFPKDNFTAANVMFKIGMRF